MYIYTLEDGKLKGLQNCRSMSLKEIERVKKVLESSGRTVIVSGNGITVCRGCRLVLSESGLETATPVDGEVYYSRCANCVSENVYGENKRTTKGQEQQFIK